MKYIKLTLFRNSDAHEAVCSLGKFVATPCLALLRFPVEFLNARFTDGYFALCSSVIGILFSW